jgi:hypothetical protein
MSNEKISDEFIEAVRKLVEATLYWETTVTGSMDADGVTDVVEAVYAVLREVCAATPKTSPLREWAEFLLHYEEPPFEEMFPSGKPRQRDLPRNGWDFFSAERIR